MSSLLPYGDQSAAPLPFTQEARIERDLRRDIKRANADVVLDMVKAEAARVVGSTLINAAVDLEIRNVDGRKALGRAYESAAADAGPITQHLLAEAISDSDTHLRNALNRAHRGLLGI